MKNNSKINKFFARCFGALILALYFRAWNGAKIDFAGVTFIVLGIIAGMAIVDISKWGFKKLNLKKK